MIPSPNPLQPPYALQPPLECRPFLSAAANNVQQYGFLRTLSPCRSITFLPIGELAANGIQVSECVPLSRPTRVLSVIPVTGAQILHGKATTTTHHHSLDSHRKAPTPSQNQPTYRPPGQKTVLEEYIEYQLSDFGSVKFTPPSHVYVSTFCHIDAVTLSSAELKFGH